MKLNYRAGMILLAAFAVASSSTAQKSMYKLDVGDFSEFKVNDGINVEYNCSTDSAGWAYFECDAATAQKLMFTNKKNSLVIQIDAEGTTISDLPTLRIYSMTLQKVENSGDSVVRIGRMVPVREFKASVVGNGTLIIDNVQTHKADLSIRTGNGHLVANGSTREANLRNVGTGRLEASGLKSERTKCNVFGTGPIDCNASASLTVTGAGSGKVYYGGTPQTITNRAIGVKAISMDTNQVID
ncbi:MAG: DUF2807 domain-containing protein [Muribaculaceae bacterium]|nr:DUF2807 domain-containing protein [Muribaculaceae bacterium]MDE6703135.1 DUF2807 domain-containing protein [Muribaculaceae bacterium]